MSELDNVPIGCGPEGTVTKYDDLVNTLETMAGSYGFEHNRATLRRAARTIMDLERQLAAKTVSSDSTSDSPYRSSGGQPGSADVTSESVNEGSIPSGSPILPPGSRFITLCNCEQGYCSMVDGYTPPRCRHDVKRAVHGHALEVVPARGGGQRRFVGPGLLEETGA